MKTNFTEEQIIAAMRGIVYDCSKMLTELTPEQRQKYAPYMFDSQSKDKVIKVYCILNHRLINTNIIRRLLQADNRASLSCYLKSAQTTPFKLSSRLDALIEIAIRDGNTEAFKIILENYNLTRDQEWKILELRYPGAQGTILKADTFVEYYFKRHKLLQYNLRKLCRSPYDYYYHLYRKYYKIPQSLQAIHFFSRLKYCL